MLKKRIILKKIIEWLPEKEFILLNGMRQVGKTSLLKLLREELLNSKIPENQLFYLNLEEIKVLEKINDNPENLLTYIIDKNKRSYFFIDEIQYLTNPSNFLKHIYDKYAPNIKIIATGSSSLEIKAKLQDSLAGRKVNFLINPLSFEEFLNFKEFSFLDYFKKDNLPSEIKDQFDKEFYEYLIYGGMPAVVLQNNKEKKQKLLESYINSYINKDIRAIGKIDNISNFNNIVKILSSQIGNLLNINEISNTTKLDRRTISKYLDLLEHTFILNKINPFKNNIRSEITKMPKFYFSDLGIRNALLGNFLELASRADNGALFENFVYLELKNNYKNKINFYRTKGKSEIDFIIEKNTNLYLFEAKFKKLSKKIDERTIKNFVKKGKRKTLSHVVNLALNTSSENIKYIDYKNIFHKNPGK